MSIHHPSGRHFLQIPGPSPVPESVLRAISMPTIDHRGPDFGELGAKVLADMREVFQTRQPVVVYPASGTGAWEAALVNTLSPGDHVLMYETGHFASLWSRMATRLGLSVQVLRPEAYDGWRRGVDAGLIAQALAEDRSHRIRAVCVVHNETSTGVTSDIRAVRRALDEAGHPALLLVDTISGLVCAEYCHDAWGVDVTVSGSQKGLMLPPGLSFNALSEKAVAASREARLPKSFWAWDEMLEHNARGYFPYTPSTNLLYGLSSACDLLRREGLAAVQARHARWAAGVRAAVAAWGLEIQCEDPSAYSPVLTGVIMPAGTSADAFRKVTLARFDCSLGSGLGKVSDRIFRIGHLGDSNDLTLIATLAACEMGLRLSGVALAGSGVQAAMAAFAGEAPAMA